MNNSTGPARDRTIGPKWGCGFDAYISLLESLLQDGDLCASVDLDLDVGQRQALEGKQVPLHAVDGRRAVDENDLGCVRQSAGVTNGL